MKILIEKIPTESPDRERPWKMRKTGMRETLDGDQKCVSQ